VANLGVHCWVILFSIMIFFLYTGFSISRNIYLVLMTIMFRSTGFSLSLEILFPLLPALHWQNVMGEFEGVKGESYSRGELSAHSRPLQMVPNGTTDVSSRKSLRETEFSSRRTDPSPTQSPATQHPPLRSQQSPSRKTPLH